MPSWWRLSLQTWLALLGLGLSLWLITVNADLLLQVYWIVFGAFLLSLAISPAADTLARRHVPRGLTVLAIYLVFLGLLATLGALLIPVVSIEIALLCNNGPELLDIIGNNKEVGDSHLMGYILGIFV